MTRDGMRAEVADSWHLSAASGVDVDRVEAPITLEASDLRDHREAHPLSQVFPLLDDVLGQAARDCGAVMAVSDAAGQLLWVCGSPSTLRQAERIGFVEGSNWDERLAGTNAPGLALRLGQPVQVRRAEHFRHSVQQWSCAATPIHDPTSSTLLGVLDITGNDDIAVPQTMAMVRAAARMAEAELARELLTRATKPVESPAGLQVVVELLGRHEAVLIIDNGRGTRQSVRLSPRHSEILLLLASAPEGSPGTSSPCWSTRRTAPRPPFAPSSTVSGTSSVTTFSPRGPTGCARGSPVTGWPSRHSSRRATYAVPCVTTAARSCRARPLRESCGSATGSTTPCARPCSPVASPT
ncbi:GAF domain-containing protein [Nocardioides piscis]|uniref:GAF domain-containing protein n=1 Tax=Nocardioides piscis TaxID=2714938 RepID=UPI001FE58D0B|nr:GAF domain-containing protein [Nocardioides piscis]